MSGHSKWSTIKHKKDREDQRRGKIFSKLVREIAVAAREGGGDLTMNARLRLAVDKANGANMPKENIDKAIKRGTGELPGITYIDATYEGYGPGGVAVLVNVLTDNKNRTASEMRKIFTDHNGNMGESGCVNWMFKKKGHITVDKNLISEEELMGKIIELKVEDLKAEEEACYIIITSPEKLDEVNNGLKKFVEINTSEITMLPNTYIQLKDNDAKAMLNLIESLVDYDDVQDVYTNFEIS